MRFIAILSLSFLLLFSQRGFSQSREMNMIILKKYSKLNRLLKRQLNKNPEEISAHYFMARMYMMSNYNRFNLESAYTSMKRAELYYNQTNEDIKKKLLKDEINDTIIEYYINLINYRIYQNIEEEKNIYAVNDFLNKHTDTDSITEKAVKLKHQLYFSQAKEVNDIQAYETFMRTFPEAKQYDLAKNIRDSLLYEKYIIEDDLNSRLVFAKRYPENNFKEKALKVVADSFLVWDDEEKMEIFTRNFPKSIHAEKLWARLFEINTVDGELSTIQYFTETHPGFPLTADFYREALKLANLAWQLDLTDVRRGSGLKIGNTNVWIVNEEENRTYDELNRRLSRVNAKTGDLQFSLMWNNYNDLDLVCIDPNGEEINYKNKTTSTGGELDVDMNWLYGGVEKEDSTEKYKHIPKSSKTPIENIYWPENSAPKGHYKVFVRHMKNYEEIDTRGTINCPNCEDPTEYTVRIMVNGKFRDYKGDISYTSIQPMELVHEFDYIPQVNVESEETPSVDTMRLKEYIYKAAPKELAYVGLLRLIENDIQNKNWNKAVSTVNRFLPSFMSDEKMKHKMDMLVTILKDTFPDSNKERILTINTQGSEYYPVISGDDSTLFFCGKDRKDNVGKEDIFISNTTKTDSFGITSLDWSEARPFEYINTSGGNEAPLSLSIDGNTLLLFSAGDIYYSMKMATGWSIPVKYPEPVNSDYWDGDAMLSSDGQAILFASNRPGGFNQFPDQDYYHGDFNYASDLYVCRKTDNGWSAPVNLGPSINTPYSERSPFLHPDMETMFFSSDGHAGLGRQDVYKVTRLSDTCWDCWSQPINLGKGFNTVGQDWGYKINTSGVYAYFNGENGSNKEDIFREKLPEELRPKNVIIITGKVIDPEGTPLHAEINWEDLELNKSIGKATSDPETGRYTIILPTNHLYGYFATKDGYYPMAQNIDLRDEKRVLLKKKDIVLLRIDKLKEMKAVKINNLFFDVDKSTLKEESIPELNRLAKLLKEVIRQDEETQLEIAGHTDNTGSDAHNQKLSEERAQSVVDFLIGQGIDVKHLKAKGYGESDPVADNDTDEGRQQNRRVEFSFLK